MKTGFRKYVILAWIPVLAFLTACNTLDRRLRDHADYLETLEAEDLDMIRQGNVGLGFTPRMVEIAWGKPDRRQRSISESGQVDAWIYISRQSRYDGRRFVGYERDVFFDKRTQTHRSFLRPVYVSTYRTVETERARVEFVDGRVVAITTRQGGN